MITCGSVPIHRSQLRSRPAPNVPVRHLSRKSWIHKCFEAAKMFCDYHTLAKDADRTLEPDYSHYPCRGHCVIWQKCQGIAPRQSKYSVQGREIACSASVIITSDGLCDPAKTRAGWGFVAYQDDMKLAEASGSHIVHTSSTRVELEQPDMLYYG